MVGAMVTRQFVIPAERPDSAALLSQISGVESGQVVADRDIEPEEDGSSINDASTDGDDIVLLYVSPNTATAKMHVEAASLPGVPLCRE